MQLDALLASCGLALDIAGVVILAEAATNKTDRRIRLEATAYYGHNGFLIRTNVEARLDGYIGVSLIVLGFLLQIEQYLNILPFKQVNDILKFLLPIMVGVAFYTRKVIKYFLLPEAIAKAMAPIYRKDIKSQPSEQDLIRVGRYMNCPRLSDEDHVQYWKKLHSKILKFAPNIVNDLKDED